MPHKSKDHRFVWLPLRGPHVVIQVNEPPVDVRFQHPKLADHRDIFPFGNGRTRCTPLRLAVDEKCFRADLLARLDGVTLRLPALRERIEEVPVLFLSIAERQTGRAPAVDARLIERLCLHDWPFNAREVDLLVRRMLALHDECRPSLPGFTQPLIQPLFCQTTKTQRDLCQLAASEVPWHVHCSSDWVRTPRGSRTREPIAIGYAARG